jgi:hypothetical protein
VYACLEINNFMVFNMSYRNSSTPPAVRHSHDIEGSAMGGSGAPESALATSPFDERPDELMGHICEDSPHETTPLLPNREQLKHKKLIRIFNSSQYPQYNNTLAYAVGYIKGSLHTVSHIIVKLRSFYTYFPCVKSKELCIPVHELWAEKHETIEGSVIIVGETAKNNNNIGTVMHSQFPRQRDHYMVLIASSKSTQSSSIQGEDSMRPIHREELDKNNCFIKIHSYKKIIPIT